MSRGSVWKNTLKQSSIPTQVLRSSLSPDLPCPLLPYHLLQRALLLGGRWHCFQENSLLHINRQDLAANTMPLPHFLRDRCLPLTGYCDNASFHYSRLRVLLTSVSITLTFAITSCERQFDHSFWRPDKSPWIAFCACSYDHMFGLYAKTWSSFWMRVGGCPLFSGDNMLLCGKRTKKLVPASDPRFSSGHSNRSG